MRKAGSHAHLATPGNDGVVESNAFPASENHEWFACERRPRHEAAFRKRMSRRHDNAEPFFLEENRAQPEGFVSQDRPRQRRGETAPRDHFPNAFRGSLFEVNGDERVSFAIVVEQAAEKRLCRRADVTQPQFTFFACGRSPDPAGQFLDLLEKPSYFPQQHGTRRRETDVVSRAFKDISVESVFQLLDCPA
jgi:hypothetical protein